MTMQFSATECAMMNFVLRTQEGQQGIQARNFSIDQLKMAMAVYDKLVVCSDGEGEEKKFVGGEVDFTNEEKVLICKLLQRSWGIEDGKSYFALKEKLEK